MIFEHCVSPSPGKRARPGQTIAKQSVGRWVRRIAQGWAGEKGDRTDRALHPSQVAVRRASHVTRRERVGRKALKPCHYRLLSISASRDDYEV